MGVFVSYTHKDLLQVGEALQKWFGDTFTGTFGEATAEIQMPFAWIPHDRHVGDDLRERIEAADSFVLVWSEHAPKSDWVHYELKLADAFGKPITILLAGGDASAIPFEILDSWIVELEPHPHRVRLDR
jgi:hypothetical protein